MVCPKSNKDACAVLTVTAVASIALRERNHSNVPRRASIWSVSRVFCAVRQTNVHDLPRSMSPRIRVQSRSLSLVTSQKLLAINRVLELLDSEKIDRKENEKRDVRGNVP
jgi:hypothetical protein